MNPNEKTLQFLIRYAAEEGWPLWAKLPKREASKKLSLMICSLMAANGFEAKGTKGEANMATKKLTPNQRLFIAEYLKDRNATRSYLAAYPSVKSENAARVNASKLLTKANIQAAIFEAIKAQEERTQITADKTLREIARVGFSDVRKLFDANGNLKTIADLDDDTAAAIAGVDVVTVGSGDEVAYIKKIKLWDKNSALEKLGKHFRMFVDKVEHSADDGLARLLREIDGRTRLLPKLNR